MPLRVHSELPAGLLDLQATELHRALGGPSLIKLAGQSPAALFVSVLLHGNETSGWDGLRRYLKSQAGALPRDLIVFIGNTEAAARSMRALPDQPDFNRIWRGASGVGGALAAAVQEAIAETTFFAAVDLHNNTGHNPYYSVLTELEPCNLGLAYLFSDKAVYVQEPDTVCMKIFVGRCPAVTLEVGPVGDSSCVPRVVDYLERCMNLTDVPGSAPDVLSLFRTRVRVRIRDGVDFRFEGDEEPPQNGAALTLTGGVEAINFHELAPGSVFGSSERPVADLFQVLDGQHRDVTATFFVQEGDQIVLREGVVPAMYTTDPYVVRQDCLCYFMERMDLA